MQHIQAKLCSPGLQLLSTRYVYPPATRCPAQSYKAAQHPFQLRVPRPRHVTGFQSRDSPSLSRGHSSSSQSELAAAVQEADKATEGVDPSARPASDSPSSNSVTRSRHQQQQLGEQLTEHLHGLQKQLSSGRHQQQATHSFPHFSLASHWEVSTGLGWQIRITNPLKLVFGKPWRKAVPLSILFFASTSIFTMLQVRRTYWLAAM